MKELERLRQIMDELVDIDSKMEMVLLMLNVLLMEVEAKVVLKVW